MKQKYINPFFFALVTLAISFSVPSVGHAQTKDAKQSVLEIKSAFFGSWKDVQDPAHLLEIYKEGQFIIVQRRSERNDGSPSNKYTVVSDKGNRIMVDIGGGSSPLKMNDDGSKITFMGLDYVRK